METTEMQQLLGAECDQGEDEEEEKVLPWSEVLPPLVRTGDGNATTRWDKDEQPRRNLGYYCRCSIL